MRSNTQIILKDILFLFEKLSSGVFLAQETQNLEITLTLYYCYVGYIMVLG